MSSELSTLIWAIFGVLITIIGALLARSIGHIDTTMKGLVQKVDNMTISVSSVHQLRKFQNERIKALEQSREVLTDAFHEVNALLEASLGKRVKLRRPPLIEQNDDDETDA